MAAGGWRLAVHVSPSLPRLAWLLRARWPEAVLACGSRVRQLPEGVFEGSWVGPPTADGILGSTTTFGSGVLRRGDGLLLVPPSHMLECIYACQRGGQVLAANSFAGLLELAGLQLDPHAQYPPIFERNGDGVFRFEVPTTAEPVTVAMYEPLRVEADGTLTTLARPREADFSDFADYRARLVGALASAIANAPGYRPLATMSSGYDSAAMGALAHELGCRRVATIGVGKPVKGSPRLEDSGARVANALGMSVTVHDRLAYQGREDFPEAEFLAPGMSGEDVVWSSMEGELRDSLVISGFMGDGMWWVNMPPRPLFYRLEQAGTSLGEFRLRVGFVHVPLPWFGASQMASIKQISKSPEMRPWVLGIKEDRPIPRRILEEAGVPRDAFADHKRSVSATIHLYGPRELAPATRTAVAAFAARHGLSTRFRRHTFPRWRRAALRWATRRSRTRLAAWLERPRRKVVRHHAGFGSLLLMWATQSMRPRYRAAAEQLHQLADPGGRDRHA